MDSDKQGEGRTPQEAVRVALEQAIMAGEGIVVLEVRRPGQHAVRARLAQIVWAAVWDALALDPQDGRWDDGETAPAGPPPRRVGAARSATAWAEVQAELVRARARFPALHSAHEGLAVLREEYREVEQLVFGRTPLPAALHAELVQVAAMALRMVEDLAL